MATAHLSGIASRHSAASELARTRGLRLGHGLVRSDIIRSFNEIATDCGGNPHEMLRLADLAADNVQPAPAHVGLPYRKVVALLNDASLLLRRPDFGLQLASRQPPNGLGGPLSIAMRHSPTLGDAFRFCADHMYTYSDAADLTISKDVATRRWILQYDAPECDLDQRQVIELSLLRTVLIASHLSNGLAEPRETWFKHRPISSFTAYKSYFRSVLTFCAPINAVTFDLDDDLLPIIGCDNEVYQLATSFIDREWVRPEEPLERKVRRVLAGCAKITSTSTLAVAGRLGMHPRTFQRRLHEEGIRFNTIKNEIARETALRYLQATSMPLIRVATTLGYSNLPAFSRRCQQWFKKSPSDVRRSASRGCNDMRDVAHGE